MKTTLLKNASTISHDGIVEKHKDIWIQGGKLIQIADALPEQEPAFADEVIDCSDFYVSPGLTNLHAHTAMNIFKGIAEDACIERWFNDKVWPYESKMAEQDVYVGTKLGIAEMINNGVTAFADHYFMEKEVLRAVQETGIRADIAPTVFGLGENYKERLAEVKTFIKENQNQYNRITFRMGPHAPYTCPMPYLKEIVDAAKELEVGVHLHVSETKEQVMQSKQTLLKTPFAVVKESGAFALSCIVAHGLWIEEEDLDCVGDDTWFAFCPKTYQKYAMGSGNIYSLEAKLNYTFGTDGAASSSTLNPVEQARCFAMIGKTECYDAESFRVTDIWKHLMKGHEAFSFNTGRIEEGMDADLVIWDLNKVNTYPVYDPLAAILYSSDSTNVRYTMVEGEFLKYNGKLMLNEAALINEAGECQKKLLLRGTGKAIVSY